MRAARTIATIGLISGLAASAGTWASPNAAWAGHKEGNGGTLIQVGEREYDLADLHFQPVNGYSYRFDGALEAELKRQEQSLERLGLGLCRGEDCLFEDEVFGPLVEYKFVAELPSSCVFIRPENLPKNAARVDAACTLGGITYILPEHFAKLDLVQKALLIVHERLHAFAPQQPYEIKTDLVRALHVLRTAVDPARGRKDQGFQLSDEPLRILNRLSLRASQIRGKELNPVSFLRSGGACVGKCRISGDRIDVGPGTVLRDVTVMGNDITIRDSQLERLTIQGSSIRILSSQVGRLDIEGREITLDRAQVQPLVRTFSSRHFEFDEKIQGERISLVNVQDSTLDHLSGSDIRIEDSVLPWFAVVSDCKRVTIRGSRIRNLKMTSSQDVSIEGSALEGEIGSHGRYQIVNSRSVRIRNVRDRGGHTVRGANVVLENRIPRR